MNTVKTSFGTLFKKIKEHLYAKKENKSNNNSLKCS